MRTSASPYAPASTPAGILEFWLGDGMAKGWPTQEMNLRWFQGGAALDAQIRARFGADLGQALDGGLQDWESDLHHRLALVILLDQFSRNVFRGTARAFAGDPRARQLTRRTLAAHEELQLPWVARVFLCMPLMHAEDEASQKESVACFSQLLADVPEPLKHHIQGNLDFAHEHQRIIARFGRFPYRNAVLGRASTAEEEEFLRTGPRYGQ